MRRGADAGISFTLLFGGRSEMHAKVLDVRMLDKGQIRILGLSEGGHIT
jgi:hypothetical protein